MDAQGETLVVWRGESNGQMFDRFDMQKTRAGVGFFFAEDKTQADWYAGRGTQARAFTLMADRVLDLTDPYTRANHTFIAKYAREFDDWIDRSTGEPMHAAEFLDAGSLYSYEGGGDAHRWNALFSYAWSQGHDAVRVLDSTDGGFQRPVWVVRDPEQIVFHVPSTTDVPADPLTPVQRRRPSP